MRRCPTINNISDAKVAARDQSQELLFAFRLLRPLLVLQIIILISSTAVYGQEADLSSQLVALHDKWFKAFDNQDSDTMNLIETKDITLVMPDGQILKNFAPRKKSETQSYPEAKRTLSNVSVREFGNSALLVGLVTTESFKEKSQSAETVSFVKVAGEWKINSAQWTDVAKPR